MPYNYNRVWWCWWQNNYRPWRKWRTTMYYYRVRRSWMMGSYHYYTMWSWVMRAYDYRMRWPWMMRVDNHRVRRHRWMMYYMMPMLCKRNACKSKQGNKNKRKEFCFHDIDILVKYFYQYKETNNSAR